MDELQYSYQGAAGWRLTVKSTAQKDDDETWPLSRAMTGPSLSLKGVPY